LLSDPSTSVISHANVLQNVELKDVEGADVLASFFISAQDFNAGTEQDFCAEDAAAYTSNREPNDNHKNPWAKAYFCPRAYGDKKDLNAPLFSEISSDDFKFNGRHRITNEMEPFGATVLH
jgi:hypothetical protein